MRFRFFLLLILLPFMLFAQNIAAGSAQNDRGALETARRQVLKAALRERNIPYTERFLFTEYGGFGASIHVFIPAALPAGENTGAVLVLGIPLSFSRDSGADFPFAFEAALECIRLSSEQQLDMNVLAVFLGDEWTDLPPPYKNPHLGLMDLYAWLETPDSAAAGAEWAESVRLSPARSVLLYLDLPEAPAELVINHGARGILAPLNILKPLKELCDSKEPTSSMEPVGSRLANRFGITFNELFKLRLAEGPSVLEFADERELQALYLKGLEPAGSADTTSITAASLGTMLTAFAGSLDISPENLDYHYLIFQVFGKTVFISEMSTIVYFLSVSALFILGIIIYSMVFRNRLIIRWHLFIRQSWIMLIFYGMLVLSLAGASVLFRLLIPVRALPFNALAGAAITQLVLGAALFSVCSPLLNLFKINQRAIFYGNAAVILVGLGILLAALMDITFISIFMWSLIFVLLAAIVNTPPLVLLCAAFSSIHAMNALWTIYRSQSPRLADLVLSGGLMMILYMAVVMMPFFILIKRAEAMGSVYPIPWKKVMIPRFVFLGITLIAVIGCTVILPGKAVPRPVLRTIDGAQAEELLEVQVTDQVLLERRILNITLKTEADIERSFMRFELYLESSGETAPGIPMIYSAPMPFRYVEDEIEFVLGEHPGNPFTTEILLPVNFSGYLRVQAVYTESYDGILKIIRRIPVGAA
jgi:hypothetical protein